MSMSMKKIISEISLIISIIVCVTIQQIRLVQADEPDLYARSALLMDASNGRVLYEENGYQIMPNASTTKIMTCILAIEYMRENQTTVKEVPVEVSSYAASMPKVHLGMRKGQQYAFDELLYSLMLESHNDTAVAIAEYIDGSVERFADRMNRKAAQLGCENTYFVTPNGLDGERDGREHATTAYDLALIAAYALEDETFKEIINTRTYTITELTSGRQTQVYNKNAFLDMMEGACGVKTGFTGKAGYCFVGALERNGNRYIAVMLACGWPPNKTWKWHDTKQLMQYGLSNFQTACIDEPYSYDKKQIAVTDGVCGSVGVYLEDGGAQKKEQELTLLLGEEDEVQVRREMKDELQAPVEAGCVVGTEKYYINGMLYRSYQIKTAETVDLRTYFYCLCQIFMLYFIRM